MYTKYYHDNILPDFPIQLNAEPYAVLGIGFCDLGNAQNGTTKHGILSIVSL